jgi:hypothetical protein
MRPWASWTAQTTMLAVGFTAAAGGLSGVALAGTVGSAGSGNGLVLSANQLIAPVLGVLGDAAGSVAGHRVAPAASALGTTRPLAGLQPVSGLAPLSAVTGAGHPSAARWIGGARDTNVTAASQLVGLGAVPGLADLPSLVGLANMPAMNGPSGGGISMPGAALSAANTSGMSGDSFAALAVGALLAGASALKIAHERATARRMSRYKLSLYEAGV